MIELCVPLQQMTIPELVQQTRREIAHFQRQQATESCHGYELFRRAILTSHPRRVCRNNLGTVNLTCCYPSRHIPARFPLLGSWLPVCFPLLTHSLPTCIWYITYGRRVNLLVGSSRRTATSSARARMG